jgi:hypothetical protein
MNKCKKEHSIIHIYQPTQHYINNTMNIIQIFKHFNINKCFEFPFGTLKGTQTLLLTAPKCKSPFVKKVLKYTCLMFAQCCFFQFFKYDSQVKNKSKSDQNVCNPK